jgi:1,4-dihydroxy-2-naphthoate octaprenyltransferase
MNRVLTNILLIAGCVVIFAGIAAFGDYYDVLIGRSRDSSYRSSWNVVENDTTAQIKTRALWGAASGVVVGLVVVALGALKQRGGKEKDGEE